MKERIAVPKSRRREFVLDLKNKTLLRQSKKRYERHAETSPSPRYVMLPYASVN